MDVDVPGIDWLSATAAVRKKEQENGGYMPVIALTTHATKEDEARFLVVGMDGHIIKPDQSQELVEAVEGFFATSDKVVEGIKLEENSFPPFDWNYGLAQADGDRELFQDLLQLFVKETPGLLNRIRQAVRQKDPLEIGQGTHAMKGSVSNFGAPQAVQLAAELERMARENDLEQVAMVFKKLERAVERMLSSIKARNSELR